MPKQLPVELAKLQQLVEKTAKKAGLDFFATSYEMLDYNEVNMVAAYEGFPVRYPHWKWGMEYDKLSKSHLYGVSKIYEMVINNDPCYAYLLESNSFVDQKLIMCHVTAHNDFFKNNFTFQHTNRKMVDEMANHASRVRKYIDWYGVNEVEDFIDKVLSLNNLIDYYSPYIKRASENTKEEEQKLSHVVDSEIKLMPTNKEYMESFINPQEFIDKQKEEIIKHKKQKNKFPLNPTKDVLEFLMIHAPLSRWQRDIIDIIREEAYYFAPQRMTKIMNEGWASYWHCKLMTQKIANSSEIVDFADRHSSVTALSPGALNPYKLGLELFRDIEDRWNKGRFGKEWNECDDLKIKKSWDKNLGLGLEKIFQVRKVYSDLNFIEEFFTLEFCKKHGFFAYEYDKEKREYVIKSRDFDNIKNKLLSSLTNGGQPIIQIIDANFDNKMELLLEHVHEGVNLDMSYGQKTLKNIHSLWNRPVHIQTFVDDKKILIGYDGSVFKERMLT